jgi:hypothetical protein
VIGVWPMLIRLGISFFQRTDPMIVQRSTIREQGDALQHFSSLACRRGICQPVTMTKFEQFMYGVKRAVFGCSEQGDIQQKISELATLPTTEPIKLKTPVTGSSVRVEDF